MLHVSFTRLYQDIYLKQKLNATNWMHFINLNNVRKGFGSYKS